MAEHPDDAYDSEDEITTVKEPESPDLYNMALNDVSSLTSEMLLRLVEEFPYPSDVNGTETTAALQKIMIAQHREVGNISFRAALGAYIKQLSDVDGGNATVHGGNATVHGISPSQCPGGDATVHGISPSQCPGGDAECIADLTKIAASIEPGDDIERRFIYACLRKGIDMSDTWKTLSCMTTVDRYVRVAPDPKNMRRWFVCISGVGNILADHPMRDCQVLLIMYAPMEFPVKPPQFRFITPNGVYEINVKICVAGGEYHAEDYRKMDGMTGFMMRLVDGFMDWKSLAGGINILNSNSDTIRKLTLDGPRYNKAHYPHILRYIDECNTYQYQMTELIASVNATIAKEDSAKELADSTSALKQRLAARRNRRNQDS